MHHNSIFSERRRSAVGAVICHPEPLGEGSIPKPGKGLTTEGRIFEMGLDPSPSRAQDDSLQLLTLEDPEPVEGLTPNS